MNGENWGFCFEYIHRRRRKIKVFFWGKEGRKRQPIDLRSRHTQKRSLRFPRFFVEAIEIKGAIPKSDFPQRESSYSLSEREIPSSHRSESQEVGAKSRGSRAVNHFGGTLKPGFLRRDNTLLLLPHPSSDEKKERRKVVRCHKRSFLLPTADCHH